MDFGRGRFALRAGSAAETPLLLTEFSSIELMFSGTRGGEAERGSELHCGWVAMTGVLLAKVEPIESVDIRRYSCLSYRVFHAWSSLTSSLQRLETEEARTKVLGSSTYSST